MRGGWKGLGALRKQWGNPFGFFSPGPFRFAACLGFVLASLTAACGRPAPVTAASAGDAERVRDAWERARRVAYAPRRFKALFKGDMSPKVGAVAHGYLMVYWDGATLTWRVSAPLAGARGGTLQRGTRLVRKGSAPFPGEVRGDDALGALLGVLDLPAEGRPVEREGSGHRLVLDGSRAARLDEQGRVVGLELPGGSGVRYEPGSGVPRRIDADGPDGRATLTLESFQPWPEGEAIP